MPQTGAPHGVMMFPGMSMNTSTRKDINVTAAAPPGAGASGFSFIGGGGGGGGGGAAFDFVKDAMKKS